MPHSWPPLQPAQGSYLPCKVKVCFSFPPFHFLSLIKERFISKQSIFPEQKAQMLHFDKDKTKPLFYQKYPFHFLVCPTSHQIKSKLTNIVSHPRTIFLEGKPFVKKYHPVLASQLHTHQDRGRAFTSPLLPTIHSTALPTLPGSPHCPSTNSARLATPPVTAVYPTRLFLLVSEYWLQLGVPRDPAVVGSPGGLLQLPPPRAASPGRGWPW